jgi:aminoglycoside phosphotransferase (APT) family kinase protein
MTEPVDVPGALIEFLRRTLDAPGLELAEPLSPLSGGFDTAIYTVRLRGAPPAFAGPLILRVLAPHHEPARVLRERAIQNAVAAQGYPAPRVLAATRDAGLLGAPFLVMERLPGAVLADARRLGMAGVLAEAQARLHALDVEPLLAALDRDAGAGGRPRSSWRSTRALGLTIPQSLLRRAGQVIQ